MCYFITLIFESKSDANLSNEFFSKNATTLYKIESKDIIINSKYALELSGCYCSSILLKRKSKANSAEVIEKTTIQLRKKVWTETKISRWIENKEHSKLKMDRIGHDSNCDNKKESEYWQSTIKSIMNIITYKKIGLIIHWVSEGPRSLNFFIENKKELKVKECTDTNFKDYNENDLIQFI
jgi:hypothetical protein